MQLPSVTLPRVQLPQLPATWLLAAAMVGGALLYVRMNGAQKTGASLGAGAVNMADGIVTGVVTSVGDRVGIPQTSADKCAAAKAAGDTWGASFACPASDFVSYWWKK